MSADYASAAPMRLAVVLTVLALLAAAPAAVAQDDPFGPLPQPAQPAPAPTPAPDTASGDDDVGRNTLYAIGAALLVTFAGLAVWITRDARSSLPEDKRREPQRAPRDPVAERHARAARKRARHKARAQRAARKKNR